jgi:hypothetical protein
MQHKMTQWRKKFFFFNLNLFTSRLWRSHFVVSLLVDDVFKFERLLLVTAAAPETQMSRKIGFLKSVFRPQPFLSPFKFCLPPTLHTLKISEVPKSSFWRKARRKLWAYVGRFGPTLARREFFCRLENPIKTALRASYALIATLVLLCLMSHWHFNACRRKTKNFGFKFWVAISACLSWAEEMEVRVNNEIDLHAFLALDGGLQLKRTNRYMSIMDFFEIN